MIINFIKYLNDNLYFFVNIQLIYVTDSERTAVFIIGEKHNMKIYFIR